MHWRDNYKIKICIAALDLRRPLDALLLTLGYKQAKVTLDSLPTVKVSSTFVMAIFNCSY